MSATIIYSGNFDESISETLVSILVSSLRSGESFDYVSNSDPAPLLSKLKSSSAETFEFEPQKANLRNWKTRIYKAESPKRGEGGCCGGGCGG